MTDSTHPPTTAVKAEDLLPFAALASAFNRLAVALEVQTNAINKLTHGSSDSESTVVPDSDDGSPTMPDNTAESATSKSTSAAPAAPVIDIPAPAPAPAPAPTADIPAVAPVNPMDHLNSPNEVASLLADTESATGSWFLVTQGIEPGVYLSWAEAAPMVVGVKKSVHTKQGSKWEALGEYAKAWERGGVIRRM